MYIKISRMIMNFSDSKMNDGGVVLLSNVLDFPLLLGRLISNKRRIWMDALAFYELLCVL